MWDIQLRSPLQDIIVFCCWKFLDCMQQLHLHTDLNKQIVLTLNKCPVYPCTEQDYFVCSSNLRAVLLTVETLWPPWLNKRMMCSNCHSWRVRPYRKGLFGDCAQVLYRLDELVQVFHLEGVGVLVAEVLKLLQQRVVVHGPACKEGRMNILFNHNRPRVLSLEVGWNSWSKEPERRRASNSCQTPKTSIPVGESTIAKTL